MILRAALSLLIAFFTSTASCQVVWQPIWGHLPLPAAVLSAGTEYEAPNVGHDVFVCQIRINGIEYPGKLVAGSCNITSGGKSISKDQFFWVAVSASGAWDKPNSNFYGALVGGKDEGGSVYVCRVPELIIDGIKHGQSVGKVIGTKCAIEFLGNEYSFSNFELFYPYHPVDLSTSPPPVTGGLAWAVIWVPVATAAGKLPAGAIQAGSELSSVYHHPEYFSVCRAPLGNVKYVGKVSDVDLKCRFAHDGKPYVADQYEVAISPYGAWTKYKPPAPGYSPDFGWTDNNNNQMVALCRIHVVENDVDWGYSVGYLSWIMLSAFPSVCHTEFHGVEYTSAVFDIFNPIPHPGVTTNVISPPPAPPPVPRPPVPQPPPSIRDCSLPAYNYACAGAGVASYAFPGCASHCAQGFHGVCVQFSCQANQFVAPVCGCQPGQ